MGELFQGLIQAKADNRRDRGEIVDGEKNIPRFVPIHKINQNRLPSLAEVRRRGRDLEAAFASEVFTFGQHFKITGGDNADYHVGTSRFERLCAAFEFKSQIFHNLFCVKLPITKPAWRLI